MGVGGFVGLDLELTDDDLEARDNGVADPERPFKALGVFLDAVLALFVGVFFFFLLDFVGVGDLEVALEDAGVDNLDLDDVGVSLRGSKSTYLGFVTDLLALEAVEAGGVTSDSSKSIKRCVLERRRELVRPLMIDIFFKFAKLRQFASIHYLSDAGKHYLHDLGPME